MALSFTGESRHPGGSGVTAVIKICSKLNLFICFVLIWVIAIKDDSHR